MLETAFLLTCQARQCLVPRAGVLWGAWAQCAREIRESRRRGVCKGAGRDFLVFRACGMRCSGALQGDLFQTMMLTRTPACTGSQRPTRRDRQPGAAQRGPGSCAASPLLASNARPSLCSPSRGHSGAPRPPRLPAPASAPDADPGRGTAPAPEGHVLRNGDGAPIAPAAHPPQHARGGRVPPCEGALGATETAAERV